MRKLLTTTLLLIATSAAAQTPLDRAKQIQLEVAQLIDALTPRSVVTVVAAGGNVQAAIDSAQPGDTIALTPGATYTGTITLRNRPTHGLIVITTAGALPSDRMTAAAAGSLAKLQSGSAAPAVVTESGAHDYALVGLEIHSTPGVYPFGLVSFGAGDKTQTSLAQVPVGFVVDRCYIHGDPTTGAKRGIDMNGGNITVSNSTISDIKGVGQDTQAIGGVNGPGPFLITNNYLEAAGENVLFGGSDPTIPNLVPSDITIIGNYISKPLAWKTQSWSVKNVVELKNAQRVLIKNNVIENSWTNGQVGYLLVLTVRDQDGNAPWSTIRDVEITGNVIRHGNQGINVLGLDDIANAAGVLHVSVRMTNVSIHDNLIYDIGGTQFGGGSTHAIAVNNGPINLSFIHNTFVGAVSAGLSLSVGTSKTPAANLQITDNIIPEGNFGVTGDGQGLGSASWIACVDAASVFSFNQIIKGTSGRNISYPGANLVGAVAFDATYSPTPIFPTDGVDAGVNVAAILAAMPGLDLSK